MFYEYSWIVKQYVFLLAVGFRSCVLLSFDQMQSWLVPLPLKSFRTCLILVCQTPRRDLEDPHVRRQHREDAQQHTEDRARLCQVPAWLQRFRTVSGRGKIEPNHGCIVTVVVVWW